MRQAIQLQRDDVRVPYSQELGALPAELQVMLDTHPEVAEAFEQLTRGRKRSYLLHVGGAKQAKTRSARAERCIPKILAGKGFNER